MLKIMRVEGGLSFLEFGNPGGKTVIYFHGAPGAPEEFSLFDVYAKKHDLHVICYDRFSIDSSLQNQAYYKYLSNVIIDKADGDKIDVIGFSIGCHVAIQTSRYLGKTVRELHLISCAAPLDGTDFLNDMAGKKIFSVAMNHPFFFTLVSYWQVLLVKIAPNSLLKILFASAVGKDSTLSKTDDFRMFMKPILKRSFAVNIKGYIRDIKQYVTPWSDSVLTCSVKTHVWHGTSDNWSPVSMAEYIRDNNPAFSSLELMENLSHYSCLYKAIPKVCLQLEKS